MMKQSMLKPPFLLLHAASPPRRNTSKPNNFFINFQNPTNSFLRFHPLMDFIHLFALCFLCLHFEVTFSDLSADRAALLRLSSAVRGNTRLWNRSVPSPCSWRGVTCDTASNRVVMLRIPSDGLSGQIPPNSIGNLTLLRTLSLRGNLLSGEIPPDLGSLSELQNLFLQNNRFTGEIPATFFRLSNLIRLDISDNRFSGELSPDFNNLPNLRNLYLKNNQFTGSIPDFSSTFSQFNVSFNRLNGRIPNRLSNFPADSFTGNEQLCGPPLNSCPGENKSNKLSAGAIAGITIGSIFGSVLIIMLFLFTYRKYNIGQRSRGIGVEVPVSSIPPSPVKPPENNFQTTNSIAVADYTGSGDGYSGQEENKDELVFFGENGLSFLLDDLLRASAEVLGKGCVGTTYKAYLDDGSEVIVKRLKNVCVSESEFREKVVCFGELYHENLMPIRGYYYGREEKLLVFDFMPMGSLFSVLHGNKESPCPLSWEMRSSIAFQVACGLQHLHSQNLCHGNIKSNNIFLTEEYDAFVAELGLTQLVSPLDSNGYHPVGAHGTPQEADVYGFGVLVLELVTGKDPTGAVNQRGLDLPMWVESVAQEKWSVGVFDPLLVGHPNVQEEIVRLLRLGVRCASRAPSRRPEMAEVARKIKKICRF